MSSILAIDPGPTHSAWLRFVDGRPTAGGRWPNDSLLRKIAARDPKTGEHWEISVDALVIEKVESFGMAVGAEVFETVYWSGRFAEAAHPLPVHRIGRRVVKLHLCGQARAKDANIRQALLDRFGGKGTKKEPGPLYGISGDVWSALAVAVTFHDQEEANR